MLSSSSSSTSSSFTTTNNTTKSENNVEEKGNGDEVTMELHLSHISTLIDMTEIIQAIHYTTVELNVDRIDLLFIHFPSHYFTCYNNLEMLKRMLKDIELLSRSGIVKQIGLYNANLNELKMIIDNGMIRQLHAIVVDFKQPSLVELCQFSSNHSIRVIATSNINSMEEEYDSSSGTTSCSRWAVKYSLVSNHSSLIQRTGVITASY